jgi:L-histidine N-alpha-methyltransferase
MTTSGAASIAIETYLTADDLIQALREDVTAGLTGSPKSLPPKWFYDKRGSQLFEEITRLPEYYPTRRERAILQRHAAEIAAATRADTLLELGAGSGEKTRLLLSALQRQGTLRTYVPVDVSGDFLAATAGQIARDHDGLQVCAVVADYERHLNRLPGAGCRLVVFLGSTIGNMLPTDRGTFLARLRSTMDLCDALLIGVDLVKDRHRLVRAYDDSWGVTAEFNRNVLHVINRELGADFQPAAFAHVSDWDDRNEWIEMRLRSGRQQTVRVEALGLTVRFAAGEEMRTEVSAKFRRGGLARTLAEANLKLDRWWTDPAGDYAVCLARPV